jgi:hypothetical protein
MFVMGEVIAIFRKYILYFVEHGYTVDEAYEAAKPFAIYECSVKTTAIQMEKIGVPREYTLEKLPQLLAERIKESKNDKEGGG